MRMRELLASVLLAGVGAIANMAAFAAPAAKPAPLPVVEIPFQKFVLPNGLTVIVHEDHKAPVVAVNIWYHVGSKDERPGRTGFAHLFEHLMFNGSENHNDEWFRPLEAAGATKMNGTTWLDRTNYFQNVPTPALDLVLWMESDRMGHLLGVIDQARLDEQRGVVQNEKRQGQNRPYGKVNEVIVSNTWPAGHPYSWETIGSMEDLNAASLEDVKEWFRTHYGAANAVLVIAGDITVADARQKVERYFGDVGSGPVLRRQQDWVARMSGTRRAMLEDRVPQARIYKVWNIPGYRHREHLLADMAADILASGKNSRLYKRLVYTDRTATAVNAFVGPFELASQVQLSVTLQPGGDAAAVERAMDEEIALFLSQGPTAEELERVKTSNYSAFVRGIERIDGFGGKSAILAESQVYGGSPDFYQRRLGWVRDATALEVKNTARAWLSDGMFVLNVNPVADYSASAASADRSKPPAVGAAPALTLPPPQRTTLGNGLKVVLVERHNAPVLDINLIVNAGFAADSLARPGTARLATLMLQEGTNTRSSLEIAARSELLGAPIGVASSLDRSFVGMNALTSRADESLELFADIVLNPIFPAQELERLRGQTLAAIQQEKAQPQGIAGRVLPALIYGEKHAYATPPSGLGNEQSVRALDSAALRDFYRQWIRPDNATLLVVGDTTLAALKPLLEKHFGAWRAPAQAIPMKNIAPVTLAQGPRVFLIDRPAAEQSYIAAAIPGPSRSDPGHIGHIALDTLLGGNFVSRINMNLREQKHWSYGARTRLIDAVGQGMFMVTAGVQTDRTADSMREVLKELRDVTGSRKPTAEEIRFVKDSLALALPGSNETSAELARSYGEILNYGLEDSYWNDFVAEVNALTVENFAAAAQKLVKPDALTWVVVGDLDKIEAGVRALNLGPVQVIDADGKPVNK